MMRSLILLPVSLLIACSGSSSGGNNGNNTVEQPDAGGGNNNTDGGVPRGDIHAAWHLENANVTDLVPVWGAAVAEESATAAWIVGGMTTEQGPALRALQRVER